MPSTILSDNGVSSGSAGLKTTAASDGSLALQTTTAGGTATTAVSIDTSQNVTFTNAANLPNTFGFKNRIINGGMMIDQRNAGASVTANGVTYSVDRFWVFGSQTSKFTAQQNAGSVTPPAGFTNYLGITSSSAYSVGSSEQFLIVQSVEGFNTTDLGFGTANASTVTLSFWVRSSLTGTFGGCIQNYATTRSYPFTYTISSANTWEQKTITIAGDTSGTWVGASNAGSLNVVLSLGVGSTLQAAANTWATGNYKSVSGATSVVGTNGATFYITGVQLEKGSTATSFDYRPYGTELQLCQRYLPAFSQPSTNGYIAPVYMYSTTGAVATVQFLVQTRVAPTGITATGTFQIDGTANFSVSSLSITGGVGVTSAGINLTGTGYVAGQAGSLLLKGTTSATQLLFTGCEL